VTEQPALMGTAEVPERLGVSRQRVLQLAQQPGFPQPVAVLRMGKVWWTVDIDAWAEQRHLR
jgi:prophage regulatory protein